VPYLFLIPAIIFFTLFTAWPIIKVIQLSFYQTNFITTTYVGLGNFISLFRDDVFIQSLKNSVAYILLLPCVNVVISLSLLFMTSKLSKKWQDASRILLYIPTLSGGIIIAQVWKWIFSINGVANWFVSLFGLSSINWFGQGSTAIPVVVFIVSMASFGGYVIILLAAITSIDKGIIESARIDGASEGQIRRKIIIPLLMPTILLIILLSMIASLQIFETIYALVPQSYAFTPTYSIYTLGFKLSKWGLASAQSVILLFITILLSIVKQKVEKNE